MFVYTRVYHQMIMWLLICIGILIVIASCLYLTLRWANPKIVNYPWPPSKLKEDKLVVLAGSYVSSKLYIILMKDLFLLGACL